MFAKNLKTTSSKTIRMLNVEPLERGWNRKLGCLQIKKQKVTQRTEKQHDKYHRRTGQVEVNI